MKRASKGKRLSKLLILDKTRMVYCAVLVIALELLLLFGTTSICEEGFTKETLFLIATKVNYGRVCFMFLLLIFMVCLFYKSKGKVLLSLFKYRYLFGTLIIIVCVCLEISGSSIGCFDSYLPEDNIESGVIFGHERLVRVDEWQKSTPMAFSQEYNKTGKYPYYSDTLRGCETDMFIVYGQPVLNPLVFFRPFHLGYLLWGSAKGLSFYWMSRLVVLFLVSMDFFMLLTDKSKKLSLIGAVFVSFAPIVQWWFAINGFVEMLIWGELAIICINCYMNSNSTYKKWLCSIGLILCSGGYILAFYPAWQVPFAYIFLAIAVWIIRKNYKNTAWSKMRDGGIACFFLLCMIVFGLYLFHMSYDSFNAIMDTAYPGKRTIFGGGGTLLGMFDYPGSVFLPLTNQNISGLYNESEAASFFSFFPLGITLAIINWKANRKANGMDIALIILSVIFSCYVLLPFPKPIATITLMKYSSAQRVYAAIGYLNIILLMKNISALRQMNRWKAIFISVIFSITLCVCSYFACKGYMNYLMTTVVFVILVFGSYFILRKKYDLLVLYAIIVVMGQGILVNPIQRGIDVIYGNPLTQAIGKVVQNNEGKWLTDNISTPLFNLPIMVGAPTINSINIYPNLPLWYKIDKERRYEQIYNRQAHIGVSIIDGETYFELMGASAFMVYLNIDDIKKVGVRYILSSRDLRKMGNGNVEFSCIDRVDGFYIFEVY